jgi:ABC-type Fe3+/spermidine/putrescine transport system ATPase subunit
MTRNAAVAMKAVRKRLGSKDVLHDLSLEVPRGGTLGILGPSGCGKTTALRLIAGLDVPDAGEIWLADRLASSPKRLHVPPRKRNIGFVFQDLALWPHLTVAGNLLFVLESRRWQAAARNARVEEMLTLVGMSDRAQEHPSHLSGGEQQRVALARALVGKPDLLLLDEPLSSLDPDLRAGLREELAAIPAKLGVTMIYVTHDRADAEAFGGEILVMSALRMPVKTSRVER